MSSINERMKYRRRKLEISIHKLADQAGVSPGTIKQYEKRDPHVFETLKKIQKALNCEWLWLITGFGYEENSGAITRVLDKIDKFKDKKELKPQEKLEIVGRILSKLEIEVHENCHYEVLALALKTISSSTTVEF